MIEIPITKTEKATTPEYKTAGSSGADLYATHERKIEAGYSALIKTGIKAEIPEGYEIQIRPRSGLALKHALTVLNAPGTIDSDYRNEIGVILINHGNKSYLICEGDRIAQAVLCKVERAVFKPADSIGSETERKGGFGHTGK